MTEAPLGLILDLSKGEKGGAMNYDVFIARLNLGEEAEAVLNRAYEAHKKSPEKFEADTELFKRDRESLFVRIDEQADYAYALFFFVRSAYAFYFTLKERGIGDEVIFDTYSDFAIWNKVCIEETGICGLKETRWMALHISGELFKLGRLQFGITVSEEDEVCGSFTLNKGSTRYYVHIPRGEPFDFERCEQSYRQALDFFQVDEMFCFCYSWFLSPTLKEILPPHSNILKFASMFEVYKTAPDERWGERFVFGSVKDNPEEYIAVTSLQREAKRLLLSGKFLGAATGVRKITRA